MAKVITFSRFFQKNHPKACEPTYFVEKFMKSWFELDKSENPWQIQSSILKIDYSVLKKKFPKHHTIRPGSRFKVGDMFSPRVWGDDINPKSGKSGPYHSKQIILAPDTEVKQVWSIEIHQLKGYLYPEIKINGQLVMGIKRYELFANDGLSHRNFYNWFNLKEGEKFKGQIICWSDKVKY